MATTTMRARFPVVLLLGVVFLASVSVTFGALAYWEQENPCHGNCLQSCARENEGYRQKACEARCKMIREGGGGRGCRQKGEEEREQRPGPHEEWGAEEQQEEEEERQQQRPRREEQEEHRGIRNKEQKRPRGKGEEQEEEDEGQPWGHREKGRQWGREQEEEEGQEGEQWREPRRPWIVKGKEQEEEEGGRKWRGPRRPQDPEEREREERYRRREKEEQQEEREHGQGGSRSLSRRSGNNPFFFPSSSSFQTLYGNQHGRIRVLQRLDERSKQFQNLQNYRLVEFESRPNTLVLPKNTDADSLIVIQEGIASVTIAYPTNRETYNLEAGDALNIPSGAISYILNPDDNQNLRIAKLVILHNKPGQFNDYFPASNQDEQSYFHGFSQNTLEAAFNAPFEDIQRILLEENESQEGAIVKVSKELIRELTRHAKSSSRGGTSSESEPFNLISRDPVYSNKFGKLFVVPPDRHPQLLDLGVFLGYAVIKAGGLMLPHYNSKATVVVVINKGTGTLELVGLREQQQQEEEEGNRQVCRYIARLSQGDVYVVPANHPIAINASSDLHLLGFGVNAKSNKRTFLAGDNENVISQIHTAVKELAFPGSGQEVEKLIKNQRDSHFVSAQPLRRDEGRQGRRGPLSPILSAFY